LELTCGKQSKISSPTPGMSISKSKSSDNESEPSVLSLESEDLSQ
jgi:hypothetical protein